MEDPISNTINYNREFFGLLEEFFKRATGKSARDFASIEAFGEAVRSNPEQLFKRYDYGFEWFLQRISDFYRENATNSFARVRLLGGTNVVLGGSSRFLRSQLNAVSIATLYGDTVLVPDPILPWLEHERRDEAFKLPSILQAAHSLLHLKPLVDADLRYPAVAVFPSFEKSLEDRDLQTQAGISTLVTEIVANAAGETIGSFEELIDFANSRPEQFLQVVDKHKLLVAPGGEIGLPLKEVLADYKLEAQKFRTDAWKSTISAMPDHAQVLMLIVERIGPIYHLIENSIEFDGYPLVPTEQQAHYFRLVSESSSKRSERAGFLDPKISALVEALGSSRLQWLKDVSMGELVLLRRDNANVEFRERLKRSIGRLHESKLSDVSRVASEICNDIESAISDYERGIREIQSKYDRSHLETLFMTAGAVCVTIQPAIAPLFGAAVPLGLAVKYGVNKVNELSEKSKMNKSVVGILATTKARK